MTRDDLLAAATEAARADPRVMAFFLTGSLAVGEGDAHSDLDTVLVVASDDFADVVAGARNRMESLAELVLWRQVYPGHPLFHAITAEWIRFDLTIATPDRLVMTRDRATPLVDRFGLHEALPAQPPARLIKPEAVSRLVEEFLRVFGLLTVALGRADYVGAITGAGLLRGLLIDLMVTEQNPAAPPGAKSLARVLPASDIAMLTALPSPSASRDSILAADLAVAGVFLPRARRLADRIGLAWPHRLEAACRAHLERELGLTLPA